MSGHENEINTMSEHYGLLVRNLRAYMRDPNFIEHVPIMLQADLDQIVTESELSVQHDPNAEPPRTGLVGYPPLEFHQVWVWMGGAQHPHWEVRGTGAIL